MVTFFPELDFIKNTMRPKPTAGEWELLMFLNDHLNKIDGNFEVYFQGNINGSFPDIVIMRKNHGVLIIEVKDWNLDLYSIKNDNYWICHHPHGGGNYQEVKSPIKQAKHYKDLFYNTYSRILASRKLQNPSAYALINTSLFFYGSSEDKISQFFGAEDSFDYVNLFTLDRLKRDGFSKIPSLKFLFGKYPSKFFTDDIYCEINRTLKPSEYSLMKKFYKDRKFSKEQSKYIESTPNKKQKIRGVAGSGKTTVMAYRVVEAFKRTGQPVLILTFNITLCNYIKDCISAFIGDIPQKTATLKNFFIISHIHKFIYDYRAKHNLLKINDSPDQNDKDNIFDLRLSETPIKYSSIFVDEIQDYYVDADNVDKKNSKDLTWARLVHQLLKPGGELVFFGDEEQNLYKRELIEDDNQKHRIFTGISGAWNTLKGSYRLSGEIADLARSFQLKYFSDYEDNEIKSVEDNIFDETTVDYYHFENLDANKILEIINDIQQRYSIHPDDICILSQLVKNVRVIDKKIRDQGFKTNTTFETAEEYNFIIENFSDKEKQKSELDDLRRIAKYNFWMESGKIKLSTIHSYKGWSIDTEILIIGEDKNERQDLEESIFLNDEMIYTGITRATKHLVIINIGDNEYDEFFNQYV